MLRWRNMGIYAILRLPALCCAPMRRIRALVETHLGGFGDWSRGLKSGRKQGMKKDEEQEKQLCGGPGKPG